MLDQNGNIIIDKLNLAGYQAYYVGGCVRDYLLKQPFNDIDIATSAHPQTVLALFEQAVPTGIAYGTVTVIVDQLPYEVTTFRRDYDYTDGRRPSVVSFSETLTEDLARRDFTINAMAMGADGQIIDPYDGQADLNARLIRAVGNPSDRFKEDKLRKLRAVRFAAQTGFALDEQLRQALRDNSNLNGVSAERILVEIDKILMSDRPSHGIRLLAEVGLLDGIDPALAAMVGFDQHNPHHLYDVFEHSLRVLDLTPADLALRWTALLHDSGKPPSYSLDDDGIGHFYGHQKISLEIANKVIQQLKMPKARARQIRLLIEHHMHKPVLKTRPLRRWISKIGRQNVEDMIQFLRADMLGTGTANEEYIKQLRSALDEVYAENSVFSKADLQIDGHQLMAAFQPLKEQPQQLGALFDDMLKLCIEEPQHNSREGLLAYTAQWLRAHSI